MHGIRGDSQQRGSARHGSAVSSRTPSSHTSRGSFQKKQPSNMSEDLSAQTASVRKSSTGGALLSGAGAEVIAGSSSATPTADTPPATLTRASVERLRRENESMREEIETSRADSARLAKELEVAQHLQVSQQQEIEKGLKVQALQQAEIDSLRLALEKERQRELQAEDTQSLRLALEKERQQRTSTSSDEEQKRLARLLAATEQEKQAAEKALGHLKDEMAGQRALFDKAMQDTANQFQKVVAKFREDDVRKRLMVHIVAPSIWLEGVMPPDSQSMKESSARLLPGGPSAESLLRALESQLLPHCAEVFCCEEGDPFGGEEVQKCATSLLDELVNGLQKHFAQHVKMRSPPGANGAEEAPAARVRVEWAK